MPASPHPLALFSLFPHNGNEQAKRAVSHSDNIHHVSILSDGIEALDVGFQIRGQSSTTLATIGRGHEADIYVEGSSIARIQCSFEMDLDTGVVMLYDRSYSQTTQVFGENATPFEHGRERKILIQKNLNTIIGMGGQLRNLVQFELRWHQDPTQTAESIKYYDAMPHCGRVENPRLSRTVAEAPTNLPSQRVTRWHTPSQPKMRYMQRGPPLGAGQSGTVYKAIDVDSGKFMAVKIVRPPEKIAEHESWRNSLKREVENLCYISHPHIINYIASQNLGESQVEIFTGLMQGTLRELVDGAADACIVANSVFQQMLEALDCIACNGIIHRDVKPENILYNMHPGGQYQFQLTDFGLSKGANIATPRAGSDLYMAPEIFLEEPHSSKADVWSLFVTILWVLDIEFREREFHSAQEVWGVVLSAASKGDMSKIQEMAIISPAQRASAAQMLLKWFDGKGLSTSRNQIRALTSDAPPKIEVANAPAPGARPLLWNIIGTVTQHRVEEGHDPLQPESGRQL